MKSYRLHASLGYNLSLASRLQERRLDDSLKSLDLTRTTWCVLLAVGNENLSQPSDIARFVGIDRTATSRALRQMEAAELVVRHAGTDDKRTTRVSLTDAGRSKIKDGTPFAQTNNDVMRAKLTDAEFDQLRRLLGKVIEGEDTALSVL